MRRSACYLLLLAGCGGAPTWPDSSTRMCTVEQSCIDPAMYPDWTFDVCLEVWQYSPPLLDGVVDCEPQYDAWLECLAVEWESGGECERWDTFQTGGEILCEAEDNAYHTCYDDAGGYGG